MTKKIKFTKEECYIIAEFYYSYQQDILIKNDVVNLINVLGRNDLIANPKTWYSDISEDKADRLFFLINVAIPNELEGIMKEYYKN